MDTTGALAEFAATLDFDRLPAPVVATVKRMILDSLGTALAATSLGDGCPETMAVMRRLGGPPESTILGFGIKVAAPHAAFANGALVHALNYDPIGAEIGHLGVVCLAAPMAMAEAVGNVSGRTLIAAAAAACEITARTTAAIVRGGRRPSEKFLSGQLLSYFGTAAGAARILGLNAAATRSALGLALMQAAGSRQVVLSGDPPAKAIYGAFPNQAGVLAALLAQEGLGADCDVFGPPAGLFAMVYDGADDAETLTRGLGTEFLLTDVQFKPWPVSNHVTPFIEAAGELVRGGLDPSDIATVEVAGHSHLRPWCEPLAKRRKPDTAAAAGNSILFCAAKTLAHGTLGLSDLTAEGLRDKKAIDLAERTTYRLDDAIEGGVVTVTMRNGERREAQVKTPLGHPSRPVSDERLIDKFRDCCTHAAAPLPSDTASQLIETIFDLDRLDDVGRLMSLASGKNGGI